MSWSDWIRTVEIEPSLRAADASRVADQVDVLLRAGARVFHLDLGDGQFGVLQALAPAVHRAGGVLDCHLLTEEPEREFEALRVAGADSVTVQFELCSDHADVAEQARAAGFAGVGLALGSETPPEAAGDVADAFDLVGCGTAAPGVSAPDFLPESLERLQALRTLLPAHVHVQADGGIDHDNVRSAYDAGADLLVAGSSIFGREDLPRSYRRLVQLLA